MGLSDEEKIKLLNDYSGAVSQGTTFIKKDKPKGTFKDTEGSRLPVHHVKDSGQPSSSTGFPKGPVATSRSWSPD